MDVDPRANIVAFQLNTGADEIVVGRAPTLAEDGVRQAWEGVCREHATSTGSVVALHTEWEPSPTDVAFIEANFPGVAVTYNFPRPTPDGWEEALAAARATMLAAAAEDLAEDLADDEELAGNRQNTGGGQHHTTSGGQQDTGGGQGTIGSQQDADGGHGSGSQQDIGGGHGSGSSPNSGDRQQGSDGRQQDASYNQVNTGGGQGSGGQRDTDGSHGADSSQQGSGRSHGTTGSRQDSDDSHGTRSSYQYSGDSQGTGGSRDSGGGEQDTGGDQHRTTGSHQDTDHSHGTTGSHDSSDGEQDSGGSQHRTTGNSHGTGGSRDSGGDEQDTGGDQQYADQGQLLPVLWSESSAQVGMLEAVPHWPVAGGRLHLALAVVAMTPRGTLGMYHVTHHQLGDQSFNELMAEACENLTADLRVNGHSTDDGQLLSMSGNLVSAMVCLPDFYQRLAELAGATRLVVGLPCPDEVYVAAADSPLAGAIQRMVHESEYPDTELVPCVLAIEGDHIQVLSERGVTEP